MQTIKDKIKETGLKATPQRIAVYKAMQCLGHASADMVAEQLKEVYPSLTVATVYNVLESFIQAGLITRRFSSNNKMYFDINTYEHVHLYNAAKDSYEDYDDPKLLKLVTDYFNNKEIDGFVVKNIEIQLVGIKI